MPDRGLKNKLAAPDPKTWLKSNEAVVA